jgi:hypothetical protein
MIRSLTILGFVFFIGCGSSNNNGTGGNGGGSGGDGTDMSAATGGGGDLAMTLPADMQPAYGCHALLACRNACSDQTSCNLCLQSATQQALGLYGMLRNCIRRTCNPHPDGGPAPCTNGGGTPSPQCTMCQDDTIKMTGSCGSDTMYCGACYSSYSACEANLP